MQTQVWHAAKKIAKSSSGILERKKGNCRIHQPISFFAVINFWPFLKNVLLTFVLANPSLLLCFTISVIFFLCVCVFLNLILFFHECKSFFRKQFQRVWYSNSFQNTITLTDKTLHSISVKSVNFSELSLIVHTYLYM